MTKNTTGGKGHKKQASKGVNVIQRDYKITSPMEVEGYVDKILGNGMIRVNSTDGKYIGLICTIRGKFKGRYKSNNKIDSNGIVIVGLREWESPFKTADLLFVSNGKYKNETQDDNYDFNSRDLDSIISFQNDADISFHDNNIINHDHDHIDFDDI